MLTKLREKAKRIKDTIVLLVVMAIFPKDPPVG